MLLLVLYSYSSTPRAPIVCYNLKCSTTTLFFCHLAHWTSNIEHCSGALLLEHLYYSLLQPLVLHSCSAICHLALLALFWALSFALVLQVQYCTVVSILFQNIVCNVNNIENYLHSSRCYLYSAAIICLRWMSLALKQSDLEIVFAMQVLVINQD